MVFLRNNVVKLHINSMRKYLYLLPLLLLTCNKEEPFVVEGQWQLERLESFEDYYLPGLTFTTDTVLEGVEFIFDSLEVYTLVDGSLSPVELIGFHYENKFAHTYEYLDTSLWIGVEEWKVVSKEPNALVIENTTVYGIVGEQLRTLYFIRK